MREASSHWRPMAALVWPNWRRYGLLTLAVVAANLLVLAGPLILRELIDRAAGGAPVGELARLAALFLAAAVAAQAVGLVEAWLATSSAWETANRLRLQLAEHVLGLDHEFHRSHNPGELIERIDGDVTSVSDFLALVVVRVGSGVLLVAGVVSVVAVLDWRLGLGMAAYCVAAGVIVYRQRNRSVAEAAAEMGAAARLYGGIEERLTASEDLRASGASGYAIWRFVEDSIHHIGAVVARERAFLRLWRNLQWAIVAGAVLALVVGAAGVERGFLTVGTAFLLFQYSQQIRRPLEDLLHQLQMVQKASGAMSRVVRLLATAPAVADAGPAGRSPPPGPLPVHVEGVSFSYGNGSPLVLHDVTLHLAAGRSVGIIGHTGGGKTTLSRLAVRLVEPERGRVLLGGVPIAEIPLAELRQRVAVVPQTVDLVRGTIRDNVTLFAPGVPDAAVSQALERVGLDQFCGPAMHHRLGSGGSGLSAGESQLLALARVWLRPADLLVLDEPTARIDLETEARLAAALDDLFQGRTVLVVAHRLSTLARVDEIVVVEGGQVVEHGPRSALDATSTSRYRQLHTAGLPAGSPGVTPPAPEASR